MEEIERYKRKKEKIDSVTTTVNLDRSQFDWVKINKINLSQLLRDFIDSLMVKDKNK